MALYKNRHLFHIIIFPIMMLLLLSCPIKREIKLFLDIPVRSVSLEKSNDQLSTCIYETAANQEKKQKHDISEYLVSIAPIAIFTHTYILLLKHQEEKISNLLQLFIYYRKLII